MTYTTIEEAEEYFSGHLNTESWDSADTDSKTRALQQSEQILSRLNLSVRYDAAILAGNENIKQAVYEIALALLDGVDPEKELNNIFVLTRSFATTRVGYDRTNIPLHFQAGVPSATAWTLLKPYLINNRSLTLLRVS